jgi:hypothetical protein
LPIFDGPVEQVIANVAWCYRIHTQTLRNALDCRSGKACLIFGGWLSGRTWAIRSAFALPAKLRLQLIASVLKPLALKFDKMRILTRLSRR